MARLPRSFRHTFYDRATGWIGDVEFVTRMVKFKVTASDIAGISNEHKDRRELPEVGYTIYLKTTYYLNGRLWRNALKDQT